MLDLIHSVRALFDCDVISLPKELPQLGRFSFKNLLEPTLCVCCLHGHPFRPCWPPTVLSTEGSRRKHPTIPRLRSCAGVRFAEFSLREMQSLHLKSAEFAESQGPNVVLWLVSRRLKMPALELCKVLSTGTA